LAHSWAWKIKSRKLMINIDMACPTNTLVISSIIERGFSTYLWTSLSYPMVAIALRFVFTVLHLEPWHCMLRAPIGTKVYMDTFSLQAPPDSLLSPLSLARPPFAPHRLLYDLLPGGCKVGWSRRIRPLRAEQPSDPVVPNRLVVCASWPPAGGKRGQATGGRKEKLSWTLSLPISWFLVGNVFQFFLVADSNLICDMEVRIPF
jgi:hypothetical protein